MHKCEVEQGNVRKKGKNASKLQSGVFEPWKDWGRHGSHQSSQEMNDITLASLSLYSTSTTATMKFSDALTILSALGTTVSAFPMRAANTDKDLKNVLNQNKEWKQNIVADDPSYFDELGSGHNPSYLWIGCADARVPANEIMGEDVGSVFVVRNVANMVVNTDFNLMSALQYAVDYLKIPHIIVCGHYDCGGVRASVETKDHVPPLENWLRNIRDVYRLHRDELDAIQDPEARHRRLVELNVEEQCLNLFKTGVVQRRRVASYKEGQAYTTPRIHACVFDPKTGNLEKLDVSHH